MRVTGQSVVDVARRSVKVGGFFDRHPILVPAVALSIAWLPYVIVFFRTRIAFGDVGQPVSLTQMGYWGLLALQIFVCVISHSLAVRTIARLFAPAWLIWGSIAFFALCPMWGMLTAADVRYPLFAMMICVITSASAFIVYSDHPKRWIWVELAIAASLVCLLRTTGVISVASLLVALVLYELARHRQGADVARLKSVAIVAGTVIVVLVLALCLGAALPIGEPIYPIEPESASGGPQDTTLIGGVLSYADVLEQSLFVSLASDVSKIIYAVQSAPLINALFHVAPYVVLYVAFLGFALARRDARALIVGLPQMGILAAMGFDPSHMALSFILPVLAAQIMFFGALLRGCTEIGKHGD